MKRQFIITLDIPADVGLIEMEEYIRQAVASDKGSLPPSDPLFQLDSKSVSVAFVPLKPTACIHYKEWNGKTWECFRTACIHYKEWNGKTWECFRTVSVPLKITATTPKTPNATKYMVLLDGSWLRVKKWGDFDVYYLGKKYSPGCTVQIEGRV